MTFFSVDERRAAWSRVCAGRDIIHVINDMTSPSFKDYFSSSAAEYATFRPSYPAALLDFVASLPAAHTTVWDCACGNGQASVPLAGHFERVIATDASREQIAHATPRPNVSYGVALADASGLEAGSVDLVTVAQALHWFPLDRFFAEARRVLAPGGALAVWCYTRPELSGAMDDIVERFHSGTCRPYWSPERHLVDEAYRSIAMPFVDVPAPPLAIEVRLTLEQFAGYLRTWSAARKLAAETGHDPVIAVCDALRAHWGADSETQLVRWPVHVRAGYPDHPS